MHAIWIYDTETGERSARPVAYAPSTTLSEVASAIATHWQSEAVFKRGGQWHRVKARKRQAA
jgi:outer membrane lipoprotein-sorting protein